MLTMKAHETQAKNNDRAEDLRTKVLDQIEAKLAGERYTPGRKAADAQGSLGLN